MRDETMTTECEQISGQSERSEAEQQKPVVMCDDEMLLPDAFKRLPPKMCLKSQVDGTERTAAEWAEKLKHDCSTAKIGELSQNYGKTKFVTIYFPGIGLGFRECRYT